MLAAQGVPIRKTLELRGSPEYYQSPQPDLGDRLAVQVYVSFDDKGEGLGVPLPAGIVRLYKSDSNGLAQFIGSDYINHTPKNETIRLLLGDSFDVTARKRLTNYASLSGCASDSSDEIVLSNAKNAPQDVLVEAIPGDWQIVSENAPHRKSSASTADWVMRVLADGRATCSILRT